MAVSILAAFLAQITETLSNVDGASNPTIYLSAFDDTYQLDASTTPPVTKCVVDVIPLVAGAYTIDLTTIQGTNGTAQDMTGLKVQFFRFKNLGANDMTITFGASNPYNLLGSAFVVVVKAGQQFMFYGNDATPDVGAGAKNIDVTGTLVQEFELTIVAG